MHEGDAAMIAISGGGAIGNNDLGAYLTAELTADGYTVIFLPSVATQLVLEGKHPARLGNQHFQELVFLHSFTQEEAAKEELRNRTDKGVILSDHSLMEGVMDVEAGVMEHIWGNYGFSAVHVRDSRYDGVIYLEPQAGSVEETEHICNPTLAAWIGTPHLAYLNHDRMNRALTWARHFLSGKEHEHKHKLLIPFHRGLLPTHAQCIDIRQSYVRLPDAPKNHRVRARGQHGEYIHFLTLKESLGGISCTEKEHRISKDQYDQLRQLYGITDYVEIVKKRWCFVARGRYHELDIFRDWDEDILLETEVPDESWNIVLPSTMEGSIVRNVSGDPEYMTRAIAMKIAARRLAAA